MKYSLDHADAEILVEGVDGEKNRITVRMKEDGLFIPSSTWDTAYPIPLIRKILAIKGPAYLCDEIMRDESPEYVAKHLHYDILGYIDRDEFRSKTILDFGCGSAASTMVLYRMLPDVSITGVELDERLLEIAHERSRFYRAEEKVRLLLSPDGDRLPPDIGPFDFVFMNAVYEHLLPAERTSILPLLWKHLKPGGILFINQTPYRWFPVETHTTSGLPLINYMPDSLAAFYARRFSKRNLTNASWADLLRLGIRGGSAGEILRILSKTSSSPELLVPNCLGLNDRIDMWFAVLNKSRHATLKKLLFLLFKAIKQSTGAILLPTLALAIKKLDRPELLNR